MKAYLFIETESKIPTEGDWFLDESGEIYQADMYETEPSMNLKRHEIPIPEGAEYFQYNVTAGYACGSGGCFNLPRPKRKVKKWKYAFVVANEIVCQTQHLSEDEVARMTCYGPKRIDETMIEVEE